MSIYARRVVRATKPTWDYGYAIGWHIAWLSQAERQARLAQMKAAHAKWQRIDVAWSHVQSAGPGSYDWVVFDAEIDDILAAGMQVLVLIDYTPPWAQPAGSGGVDSFAPVNISDYANFVADVVGRYRPLGVTHYELWNEPNISNFWKDTVANPVPNPARYAQLVQASYTAAKAVASDVTILTGGTAPAPDAGDGSSYKPSTFLRALYDNGAGGYFDAVAHHPYTYPALPSDEHAWNAWCEMTVDWYEGGTVHQPSLRTIMTEAGDAAKKIWMTEFGAPTSGTDSVSEQLQADIFGEAIAFHKSYDWAGPLLIYNYQDLRAVGDPVYGTDRENYFGLRHFDGSDKPAFQLVAHA